MVACVFFERDSLPCEFATVAGEAGAVDEFAADAARILKLEIDRQGPLAELGAVLGLAPVCSEATCRGENVGLLPAWIVRDVALCDADRASRFAGQTLRHPE